MTRLFRPALAGSFTTAAVRAASAETRRPGRPSEPVETQAAAGEGAR